MSDPRPLSLATVRVLISVANGVRYDLTSATAAALGITQTSRIGAVRASS